ncbi:MAG: ATPase [Bacteroidetes bacterium RIFOXYA12_FULL_35_11]|nr:MAG: ATPase [Bacteroidetes bacterium GWF2_35_48]OFY73987.1 MAG: ATPase [Bacteroidetes bacterium RIFOXYA12_FULL_35_11]OFY95972.1 MAG: ATPase [Bacteroidetes bacterium RIFOXYB2_FULL_35_7]HBX52108.1 ATPase [Bacteroidales bacterium]
MKFYNRETELQILDSIRTSSESSSKMTFVVGRRRIGKTKLLLKSVENTKYIYFFIARKDERLLCAEFIEEVLNKLEIKIYGKIETFKELFEFLMNTSREMPFTLIIDEFQEFNRINPAIFSEMQKIWDLNKDSSKLNLILSGSVYSMMKKIFEHSKEPLFGRANERIHLKPFRVDSLKQLFSIKANCFKAKDFLSFYILTGGVAKYVEIFIDKNAFTLNKMLDIIFAENSIFIDEGKNILIEEFGKDYAVYFSILSLIASSKTSRSEIESVLVKNVGGYLDKLENEYMIIQKVKPFAAKDSGRIQKYYIEDNFLNFWFRFIYKYRSAVEIENFDYVKQIVKRDFDTFSGSFLEKYFIEKTILSKEYTSIGRYWEKGNQNEIDLIALNQKNKKILFAEVKINSKKASINALKEKSKNLLSIYKNFIPEYQIFSLDQM